MTTTLQLDEQRTTGETESNAKASALLSGPMETLFSKFIHECPHWHSIDDAVREAVNPKFDARHVKTNNWRRYIPDYMKSQWGDLSIECRLVAMMFAGESAFKEDW